MTVRMAGRARTNRAVSRRIGPHGSSFHWEGNRLHFGSNELLFKWNEFHSECKELVFDKNQFHSGCNEFHSAWNEFHSECN